MLLECYESAIRVLLECY